MFGLKRLGSPATARQGNRMAALAMLIAIVATLVEQEILNWQLIALGIILGSLAGAIAARTVKMTDMPQMVGIFNGLGAGPPESSRRPSSSGWAAGTSAWRPGSPFSCRP